MTGSKPSSRRKKDKKSSVRSFVQKILRKILNYMKKHKRLTAAAFLAFLVLFLSFVLLLQHPKVQRYLSKDVTEYVLAFRDDVHFQAEQQGIPEYTDLLLAIMMQESGGLYDDVFQCSESPFNIEYDHYPGAITDPYYSIRVGVETFAWCLEAAGCTGLSQTSRLKLALQNYNYGNEYASWALENYGGYSEENALEFSQQMAEYYGWEVYGDPEYVEHVLRYYPDAS